MLPNELGVLQDAPTDLPKHSSETSTTVHSSALVKADTPGMRWHRVLQNKSY